MRGEPAREENKCHDHQADQSADEQTQNKRKLVLAPAEPLNPCIRLLPPLRIVASSGLLFQEAIESAAAVLSHAGDGVDLDAGFEGGIERHRIDLI